MDLITFFEYVGTFVFAISGTLLAIEKKMDFFGVVILATVTAIGGGVIRDVVTDVGIPVFFSEWEYMIIVLVAVVLTVFLRDRVKWRRGFVICDAIGLASFAVASGMKAIELNYNFMVFIFVSLITAIGGGIMRDILASRVPTVLKREVYAVAALIGAVVLWGVYPLLGPAVSSYSCIALIITIRLLAKHFHWSLPYVNGNRLVKNLPDDEKKS